MCRLCGEQKCRFGNQCHLGLYMGRGGFRAAKHAVEMYQPDLQPWHDDFFILTSPRARLQWLPGIEQEFRRQAQEPNARCHYCGQRLRLGYEIDHSIPWRHYIRQMRLPQAIDGWIPHFVATVLYNDPRNLRLACPMCNRVKGARMPDDPRFLAWLAGRRQEVQEQEGQQQGGQQQPAPPVLPLPQRRQYPNRQELARQQRVMEEEYHQREVRRQMAARRARSEGRIARRYS